MTKAEKFIKDYTKYCSNELDIGGYHEWLTPEQARRAVEIAREEALQKEPVSEEIGNYDHEKVTEALLHLQEEPVSDELEYASEKYACRFSSSKYGHDKVKNAFIVGANWDKKQFETHRLAACDKQTEEEAEIEYNFVMGIIKNEHRQPTFDDAIKYGMKLKEEKDNICYKELVEEVYSHTRLDEAATKYAQDKKLPVQTKQAYIAGANMMYGIMVEVIEKACDWLRKNIDCVMCIDDFRKAMTNEQGV